MRTENQKPRMPILFDPDVVVCPCRGCANRHVSCHAECVLYAEYRKSIEESKAKLTEASRYNRAERN